MGKGDRLNPGLLISYVTPVAPIHVQNNGWLVSFWAHERVDESRKDGCENKSNDCSRKFMCPDILNKEPSEYGVSDDD